MPENDEIHCRRIPDTDANETEERRQHLPHATCLNTIWRIPSPSSKLLPVTSARRLEHLVEEDGRFAAWSNLCLTQESEPEPGSSDDKVIDAADYHFRILTAATGANMRHLLLSQDGRTEEERGLDGIEGLLRKHLGGDDGPFVIDYALHFYRRMHELMKGSYILTADIDEDSDVINIRIIRPDGEELRFPNRFMLFESSGWWLA